MKVTIATSLITAILTAGAQAAPQKNEGTITPSSPASALNEISVIRSESGQLIFVASDVIDKVVAGRVEELSDLELSEDDRAKILERYATLRDQERSLQRLNQLTPSGCVLPPLHADTSGHDPASMSFQDLVDLAPTVVVGEVSRVVPGLLIHWDGVASTVVVEVEEIKKAELPRERIQSSLYYFQHAGELQVEGVSTCGENSGFHEVQAGDRIFLLGNTFSNVNGWFRLNQVFRLTPGGEVLREPYLYLKPDSGAVALQGLRF